MSDRGGTTKGDLLAGLVAIVAVVGSAIFTQVVGADLRVLFGVSGVAFFLAGLARPGHSFRAAWLQGFIVSLPGLLGDVALIINNGLGRLDIPLAITLTSIASAAAGVASRRLFAGRALRAIGLAALFAAALAAWVTIGLPQYLTFMSFRWSERTAPSLQFTSLDGTAVHVPDPRGRIVVLGFWATWCLPCRWELPELARVAARYAHEPRVAVWAVDVGWGPESPALATKYLARRALSIPAAFDSGFSARALGVHALPSIALIDGSGRVRITHVGYDRSEDLPRTLSSAIERLLAEAPAGSAGKPLRTSP